MIPPVVHSDREWLLIGVAGSCAAKGYEQTTVADICATAGVSLHSFERLFEDKDDCFAAAMESLLDEAQRRVDAVASRGKPWASTLRDGASTLLDLLAERPAFARMALVEVPAAGGRAAALLASSRASVLSFVERGPDQGLEEPGIPSSAGRGALAGAEALIVGQILAGRAEQLNEVVPDIVYLLAVPYMGREQAQRLATRPVGRHHLRAVA